MSHRNVIRTDWKVYKAPELAGRPGDFVAATKHPADAAILVAHFGPGAQIKFKHHTLVWTEGKEHFNAVQSYDMVGRVCIERVNTIIRENAAKAARENDAVVAARRARGETT